MNRRRFLLGAGGALLALPLLPSRATGAPWPLRFVCVYTGNGYLRDHYMPHGEGAAFELQGMLTPLAAHRDRLLVTHGASGPDGHYAGHSEALTGRPASGSDFAPTGGPSLDQLLAADTRGVTPLASLELGVAPWSSVDGVIAFTEGGLPIPPLADPRGGFDRVHQLAAADPAAAARLRAQRRSVLDSVLGDVTALQARLAASERRLVDQHLTLLREQEQALAHPVELPACDVGAGPGGGPFTFADTCALHLDTIVSALRCDVTRVATLVLKGAQDTTYYTWAGAQDDAHSVAHGAAPESERQLLAINTWQAGQVAALLDRLAAVPEGDGTLLDHTLVMWTNEIGLHAWSHARQSMGVVLAGATDRLRTGRVADLTGASYQDLLLTLAHAMGHVELASFGDGGRTVLRDLLR